MNKEFIFILVILFIIPLSFYTAFANPSMEITRQGQIDVTTDSEGVLELNPSNQYDFVQINNAGLLSISPDNIGSDSINSNMELLLGDINNPQSDYAFTIRNLAPEPISAEVSIEPTESYDGQDNSVQYYIETSEGIEQINTGESINIPIESGELIHISVQINSENAQNIDTNMKIIGEKL